MSCIKQERKGRFLIQEVLETSITEYYSDEVENINDNSNIRRKKAKRHQSGIVDNKFSHNQTRSKVSGDTFKCEIFDYNNERYIDSNNIWTRIQKSSLKISDSLINDRKLFKYYPTSKDSKDLTWCDSSDIDNVNINVNNDIKQEICLINSIQNLKENFELLKIIN